MKITPEVLNSGEWLSEDIFKFYGGRTYKKLICKRCGEECLSATGAKKKEAFCTRRCSLMDPWNKDTHLSKEIRDKIAISLTGRVLSEVTKRKMGEKSRGRKQSEETIRKKAESKTCPYRAKGIPRYDLFVDRLEPIEQCRRNEEDSNILEVRCVYCGKWYIPSINQVSSRITNINSIGGCHFYCSHGCKKACPIYMKTEKELLNSINGKPRLNREVQPELRQLVFLRDGYECQKCGSHESLHCHHITGVEQNPIESADVDNCITFCKACHKEVHKEIGCRYIDLRGCIEDTQTMVVNI